MTTILARNALFVYGSLLDAAKREAILGHQVEVDRGATAGFRAASREVLLHRTRRRRRDRRRHHAEPDAGRLAMPRRLRGGPAPLHSRGNRGGHIRWVTAMLGLPSDAEMPQTVGRIISENVALARVIWLRFANLNRDESASGSAMGSRLSGFVSAICASSRFASLTPTALTFSISQTHRQGKHLPPSVAWGDRHVAVAFLIEAPGQGSPFAGVVDIDARGSADPAARTVIVALFEE